MKPHMYMFYCPKCGYHKELPTKTDWALEKKNHKVDRCALRPFPDKNRFLFARQEIAEEAIKAWEAEHAKPPS